jgi:hypothetical protein
MKYVTNARCTSHNHHTWPIQCTLACAHTLLPSRTFMKLELVSAQKRCKILHRWYRISIYPLPLILHWHRVVTATSLSPQAFIFVAITIDNPTLTHPPIHGEGYSSDLENRMLYG